MFLKEHIFIYIFLMSFYSYSLTKEECEKVIELNKNYIFSYSGSFYMPSIYSVWKANEFSLEVYEDITEIAFLRTPTAPQATLIFGHSLSDVRQYWQETYGAYDICKSKQHNSKPAVDICCFYDENPYKRQLTITNQEVPTKYLKLEIPQELPMELDCR